MYSMTEKVDALLNPCRITDRFVRLPDKQSTKVFAFPVPNSVHMYLWVSMTVPRRYTDYAIECIIMRRKSTQRTVGDDH